MAGNVIHAGVLMALDKAALGQRYTCYECETKFYDLNRPEPICPSCGADQRERPDIAVDTPAPKAAKPTPKEEEADESTAEAEIDAALSLDIDIDDDDDDDEEMGLSELGAPEKEESEGEEF